ncbi:tetratricopeptide repeat protein [Stieleria varia]|uniref:tetratricopeptide repeat protein n=1 Tax=Stieleria varia TaxID=2528005 RepID=UPI001E3B4A75|nr:hypothetical protein [Stieleria varia]
MASADSGGSHPKGNESLSPVDGGRWRPVSPDELLRKKPTNDDDRNAEVDRPKVTLQRRQELEQHLKSSPTDVKAFLELAGIYRSEQRPLEAKRLLTQAAQIFPDNETVKWELEEAILARSLQQLREVSDLVSRLKSADAERELDRSRSDWACRRIDVCRARLQRDPSLVHLHIALAEALYDAGIFEDAFERAGEVLDNDELSPTAHLLRGRCLLATGKDLQAMSELRAATMRRSVPSPARIRLIGAKLLCETAKRLGLDLTLKQYQQQLAKAENDSKKSDG